jgi:3-hydroxyisobutyrate dehydrogenase-like beta-hydroxyacid dehydrogenase
MMYEQLSNQFLGFLDAPVSGGREKAEAGTLAIIVSGMEQDKFATFPLLRILGTPIDCGSIPTSQIIKLINQILVGC